MVQLDTEMSVCPEGLTAEVLRPWFHHPLFEGNISDNQIEAFKGDNQPWDVVGFQISPPFLEKPKYPKPVVQESLLL